MDKEIIKQVIREMFLNEEIKIRVSITPEYAESGDGQWNVTKTTVTIDGGLVYQSEGDVEIIEGI